MKKFILSGWLIFLAGCQVPLPSPGPVWLKAPERGVRIRKSEVVFIWDSVPEAKDYELQLALNARFNPLVFQLKTTATCETLRLTTDGVYYWRVRAWSSSEIPGEWSEVRSLELRRFSIVTSLKTQGYAQDIWVADDRAYVADGQAGLAVFDLSSPQRPRLVGSIMDSLNEAWGVVANGNIVHLAYGYKELRTIDATNPESLRVLGELEYPQPGFGYDIDCRDSMVYIAANAQFIIVNCADPKYPGLVFQTRYPYNCRGVCVSGNYCYLALEQLGVAVWDISSLPPVQVAAFDTPANARSVAAEGDYLYVADGRDGLIVADISNPFQPVKIGSLSLTGYANRISVCDTLVYVGCSAGGLAVVNVKNPRELFLAAQIGISYTRGAQEYRGYVFACDRDSGLVVIRKEE